MSLILEAQLANLEFHEIPILDFSVLSEPVNLQTAALREALVVQIRDACVRVGFFYVKNHGVAETVTNGLLTAMRQYFDRPLDEKMELSSAHVNNDLLPRGYMPVFDGHVGDEGGSDLLEAFFWGFRRGNEETHQWPESQDMQEFRAAALAYYQAVTGLGDELFRLIAESLALPPNWFEDKTQIGGFLMKSVCYPPQSPAELEDAANTTLGLGTHIDWLVFTILWQQPGLQALEVLSPSGQWIDAPALPGTFIVNVAESLTKITNGIYKSTKHRVINRAVVLRYSVPTFFGMDYETLLEPITSCISPERPPQYEVITVGEDLRRKVAAGYVEGSY